MAAGEGFRAKLYELNDEGQWDDRGTGTVQCAFSAVRAAAPARRRSGPSRAVRHNCCALSQACNGTAIMFVAEGTDSDDVLTFRVGSETKYTLQGGACARRGSPSLRGRKVAGRIRLRRVDRRRPRDRGGSVVSTCRRMHPSVSQTPYSHGRSRRRAPTWRSASRRTGGAPRYGALARPRARARESTGKGGSATDGRCVGPRLRRSRIQRVQGSADDDTDKLSGDENTEPLHGAALRAAQRASHRVARSPPSRTVAAADRSTLPEPKVDNLPQLAEILQQASFATRDSIVAAMTERGYLESLLQLFSDLEDLEDKDGVAALFGVFKALRACTRARRRAVCRVGTPACRLDAAGRREARMKRTHPS